MNPEIHFTIDEAHDLAALMRDKRFEILQKLIRQMRRSGEVQIRSRKNGLQDYGYWSGVIQVCEDLETLPEGIAKQLTPRKEEQG